VAVSPLWRLDASSSEAHCYGTQVAIDETEDSP
jgi:hypothetical protein